MIIFLLHFLGQNGNSDVKIKSQQLVLKLFGKYNATKAGLASSTEQNNVKEASRYDQVLFAAEVLYVRMGLGESCTDELTTLSNEIKTISPRFVWSAPSRAPQEIPYKKLCNQLVHLSMLHDCTIDTGDITFPTALGQALALARPYKHESDQSFEWQSYFITHVVLVCCGWGKFRLNRLLFIEEFLFLYFNMPRVISKQHHELIGEFLFCLRVFSVPDDDPVMQSGYHHLVSNEGKETGDEVNVVRPGNWAKEPWRSNALPTNSEDRQRQFYRLYHTAYCGLIGLAERAFDDSLTLDQRLVPSLSCFNEPIMLIGTREIKPSLCMEMKDSSHSFHARDFVSLFRNLDTDGYLLIRNVIDSHIPLALRALVVRELRQHDVIWSTPYSDVMDACLKSEKVSSKPSAVDGLTQSVYRSGFTVDCKTGGIADWYKQPEENQLAWAKIGNSNEVRALLRYSNLCKLFSGLFSSHYTILNDATWMRAKAPGKTSATAEHIDYYHFLRKTLLMSTHHTNCPITPSPTPSLIAVPDRGRMCSLCKRHCINQHNASRRTTTQGEFHCVQCAEGPFPFFTCWFPLGPVAQGDGTLAVVSGSHKMPGSSQMAKKDNKKLELPHTWRSEGSVWCVPPPLQPGDLILFNFKTIHASTPNQSGSYRLSLDARIYGPPVAPSSALESDSCLKEAEAKQAEAPMMANDETGRDTCVDQLAHDLRKSKRIAEAHLFSEIRSRTPPFEPSHQALQLIINLPRFTIELDYDEIVQYKVVAKQRIPAQEVITVYGGIKRFRAEVEERKRNNEYTDAQINCLYEVRSLGIYFDPLESEADHKKPTMLYGYGKYFNHSKADDPHCNIQTRLYMFDNEPYILMLAKRNIFEGEELRLYYNDPEKDSPVNQEFQSTPTHSSN